MALMAMESSGPAVGMSNTRGRLGRGLLAGGVPALGGAFLCLQAVGIDAVNLYTTFATTRPGRALGRKSGLLPDQYVFDEGPARRPTKSESTAWSRRSTGDLPWLVELGGGPNPPTS